MVTIFFGKLNTAKTDASSGMAASICLPFFTGTACSYASFMACFSLQKIKILRYIKSLNTYI